MSAWSLEQVTLAVDLCAAGKTHAEIAERVGRSREAVSGVLHRRGVALSPGAKAARDPARRPLIIATPPQPYRERKNAWAALPGSSPQPLLAVPRGGCKWPIGHDAEQLFCCEARAATDNAYCPHHRKIASGRT